MATQSDNYGYVDTVKSCSIKQFHKRLAGKERDVLTHEVIVSHWKISELRDIRNFQE
jgi:hypothetical protein